MPIDIPDRPSLTEVFEPPDASPCGILALACGFSADELFLRAALDRFTGLSARGRSSRGDVDLVLLTDPSRPHIADSAGLLHVFPEHRQHWPFRAEMMHAKVALLAFGPARAGDPDCFRLVVSTGNWTMSAANESIDLVWTCELSAAAIEDSSDAAADVRAAATFFRQLVFGPRGRGFYAVDPVMKHRIDDLLSRAEGLAKRAPEQPGPRFISTLVPGVPIGKGTFGQVASLAEQVVARFAARGKPFRNALLVCGSGFFENPSSGPATEPDVLEDLVARLKTANVIPQRGCKKKWLVVNPQMAGAVGPWVRGTAQDDLDWELCKPQHPDYPDRGGVFLHAKYVCVTSSSDDGRCGEGLLYLGSGNLSRRGFTLAPVPAGSEDAAGNIEAGVVIDLSRDLDEDTLCDLLGIHREDLLVPDDFPAESESAEPLTRTDAVPPPVLALSWDDEARTLTPHWLDDGPARPACTVKLGDRAFELGEGALQVDGAEPPPGQACLKSAERCWTIPVYGADGRLCHPPAKPQPFDEVLELLRDFPSSPEEDDAEEENDGVLSGSGETPWLSDGSAVVGCGQGPETLDTEALQDARRRYPIHRAMALVETVADQSQRIEKGQIPDWVAHLRRVLLSQTDPETVAALRDLGVNFLAPLRMEGFAPPGDDKALFAALVQDIESAWQLTGLPALAHEREEALR